MTPLERQLLDAFESLSNEHAEQHAESVEAGRALRELFETTRAENAELLKQVRSLSAEVQRLAELVMPSSPSGAPGGRPSRR